MKILRTEPSPVEVPPAAFANGLPADTLLVFVGEDGALGRWLLLGSGKVVDRGDAGEIPQVRAVLAVPGTQVAIHWLDLPADLAPIQAAAAARLMLSDRSVQPLGDMHVAAGGQENGLTCVAVTPLGRMADWLATAAGHGLGPALIIPEPLLLPVPEEGLVRRALDYRGPAQAFSLEPELARHLVGEAPVVEIDAAAFERNLAAALADPLLNLRQGAFVPRRRLKVEGSQVRRLGLLALALLLVFFAVQVATILRYTFAADRLEAEASEIARETGGIGRLGTLRGAGAGYAATAAALFGAIQATPNVEMTQMAYLPDGTLRTTVQADSAATLAAIRERIEAAGFVAEPGELRSGGGRPTVDLTVRPL